MSILKTKDLIFEYKTSEINYRALDNINLDIEKGSFVVVLGHNGSGKSTLAKHFNGLFVPYSGDVFLNNLNTKNEDNIWKIRQSCGMVFQNPDNQIIATMVEEDVAFGLENIGIEPEEMKKRINFALNSVNMQNFRDSIPSTLSGGQKQRIAIAGILAMKPECIIFDEPTAMLDPIGRRDVISTIHNLIKEGITVVLITHFMEEAIKADRIIVMDKGKIVMDDIPKNIFSDIEKIKKYSLELPQITELANELNILGLDIPKNILSISEMVDFLKNVLKVEDTKKENWKENLKLEQEITSNKILEIKDLNHIYSKGTPFEKTALKNINFDIYEGSFVGIIGHTGSGKSTLVQHLNSLLKPTSGNIFLNGEDINEDKKKLRSIRQNIGLVFQYPEHQLFETSVFKDVAYGPKNMGFSEEEINKRVVSALELVGISNDFFEKSPFDLSGGQKRRVAIAGILAMQPKVLILDEPTAGLDPIGRIEILEQINELHKRTKNTVIIVSHSMEDIAKLTDSILVLNNGEIKYTGTPSQVFSYTYELEKIGLSVPVICYLMHELNKIGFYLPKNIFTVKEAAKAILDIKK
ncbi:MAG: energy-coupling factor transporter ATPase [Defluviitaleaceae bacterium]|nr:energy-coupling factor transporter ATPase [Defluviitaleaceae bacterium]